MKFHSNIYGWDYVWRDFAEDKGGEVLFDSPTATDKGEPQIVGIVVPIKDTHSELTITTFVQKGKHVVNGTGAIAEFTPINQVGFSLRTEKFIHQFGKALKMQDIVVGDKLFDSRFLIQGDDPACVVDLFADVQLRELLLLLPTEEFRVLSDPDDFPPGFAVRRDSCLLSYAQESFVDKFESLDAIYNSFRRVLTKISGAPGEAHEVLDQSQVDTAGRRLRSPLLDRN